MFAKSRLWLYALICLNSCKNHGVLGDNHTTPKITEPAPDITASAGGAPVVFVSDLTWGPKRGWEGSTPKGAAVTLWGRNFGPLGETSFVTVNGAAITNPADYAEWGTKDPARKLERITFWLNSNCQDGDGTLFVTVNGVASNALPFTVTAAPIYFISVSDGNNSYDGTMSSYQSGQRGPWKDIYAFKPLTSAANNVASITLPPKAADSYIVYVRGGSYTQDDAHCVEKCIACIKPTVENDSYSRAIIGYPGESPLIDLSHVDRGGFWLAKYAPYYRFSNMTYAKLTFHATTGAGEIAFSLWGDNTRIVGNSMRDLLADERAGVIMVDNSQNTRVYANLFAHNGYDSYKHDIYIKTHPPYIPGDKDAQHTDIGWNEFSNAVAKDTHGGQIFISKASNVTNGFTRDIAIHHNFFHDGEMEFVYTGDNVAVTDIYIYDNIFSGNTCTNFGLFIAWDSPSTYVFNNTFYKMGGLKTDGKPVAMIGLYGNSHAFFSNNILVTKKNQPFWEVDNSKNGTLKSTNDLYFSTDTQGVPSGAGLTVTAALLGDPLLTDVASANFAPQVGSPAIDSGVSVTIDGATLPGVEFDYLGAKRTQNSVIDRGAVEHLP